MQAMFLGEAKNQGKEVLRIQLNPLSFRGTSYLWGDFLISKTQRGHRSCTEVPKF